MSKRAVIYLRISQDVQGDGLAVARQRADCERIVQERGWTVVGRYEDTVSASKRRVKRPRYDAMLEHYRLGGFDALVCWDLDRLTRQPRQLEDWIDAAEESGLVLVTANGEADLSHDNGRMFARVKAAVAKAEIERKSARQKAKNLQRSGAGEPVPGRRRYGYLNDNRTLDPGEAARVAYMFDAVRKGASLRSLAAEQEWTARRVRATLTNPAYWGAVTHKGVTRASDAVAACVSRDVFDDVQTLLSDPTRKTSADNAVKHQASGIARCGTCGGALLYMRAYRCKLNAGHPAIKKEFLDAAIEEEVFMWIAGHPDADTSNDTARLRELSAEAADLNRRRGVLMDLATDEGADLADFRKRLSANAKRLEVVSVALAAERAANARTGLLEQVRHGWWDRRDVAEYTDAEQAALDAWPAYWAALPLETRRQIIKSMFTVTVYPGRGPERIKFEWK